MKVYLVGGAVRDRLLGLPVKDRDWLVVGATAEQMREQGFLQPDTGFPVFLHPKSGEEYALARIEHKQGSGYRGFRFDCHPGITLEQDLQRRDLTINAMAEDEQGRLIDPFGGEQDLRDGMLRHVSPAFVEDPLRLLRCARFAARLGRWGFRVSHGTFALLKQMAASGELQTLSPERFWEEMSDALASDQPWRFFTLLQHCGALAVLAPPISRLLDGDDDPGHDSVPARLLPLQRVSGQGGDLLLRKASLLQYLAADDSWLMAQPCERELKELLTLAREFAGRFHAPLQGDAQSLLALFDRCRAWQRVEPCRRLLTLMAASDPLADAGLPELWQKALEAARQVDAGELQQQGFSGRQLGEEITRQRLLRIQRQLDASGERDS